MKDKTVNTSTVTTNRKVVNREGKVVFGDFSLKIWEEGLGEAREMGGFKGADEWEKKFRRDVFKRVIQQLNRLGWAVGVWDEAEDYKCISHNYRTINKGDSLHGQLKLSGRCISLEMWQSANTPTRPDYNGRYESNKYGVAPYLIRLEMERTRRRIRDYLCNVFSGYTFDEENLSIYRKPLEATALEMIHKKYEESSHFKGDISNYNILEGNRKSADGSMLEHGKRVWFFDRKGRCCTGVCYYNINNMWWVVTGKYDYTNMASFELYTQCPEKPRTKRNKQVRRRRLEAEISTAVKKMDFEKAAVLRDIIYPPKSELFVLWNRDSRLYHRAGFCGYTANIIDAGKFTYSELSDWADEKNEVRPLSC
ncbi:UvrB/UvrC motif-containing protein [Vibrio phage vB_VpaM_XM1]